MTASSSTCIVLRARIRSIGVYRPNRKVQVIRGLFGLIAEEGDEVVAVLGLLETAEGHLGAGNVLLRVF